MTSGASRVRLDAEGYTREVYDQKNTIMTTQRIAPYENYLVQQMPSDSRT